MALSNNIVFKLYKEVIKWALIDNQWALKNRFKF